MVVGGGLRAKGGAESKHIASRLSRFSVVFVGCIVISRSSLSDFGRRLLSLTFVRCIVISLLSLSDFGRRLLSHFFSLSDFGRRPHSQVFVSCIVFSLLGLSGFRLLGLSDFGRRLHGAWSAFVVGSWVPPAISLRVVRGGSSGV